VTRATRAGIAGVASLVVLLLLRRPVIAIVIAHLANNWGLYMLLSWLPSYFRDARGVSVATSGFVTAGANIFRSAGEMLSVKIIE
jgi:hypothetical protein